MTDLIKRAEPFLNQCPSCDAGLPKACTCQSEDFRPVMLDLVREIERLKAEAEKDRKFRDDEEERLYRYFDRITKGRGEALRRAEKAEAEVRRVTQSAEAYRMSAIEHAGEVSERDAELAAERERSARLARVIEELGGELIEADGTGPKPADLSRYLAAVPKAEDYGNSERTLPTSIVVAGHQQPICVASKHIPAAGETCSVCGAAGMQSADAWCEGIHIPEKGPDGRYVAARCGSTNTHSGHWLDGRDELDVTDSETNPGGEVPCPCQGFDRDLSTDDCHCGHSYAWHTEVPGMACTGTTGGAS